MITPEEGAVLTRIAVAGYRVEDMSLSIWGSWSVSATHPELGTITTHGSTRLRALEALLAVASKGTHGPVS